MKILVFCHQLEIGGTLNCIELAAALRDIHGHEIVFFATPGPNLKYVEERGLSFLPAPATQFHPSPARMRALREVVRRERPDLIYVWEYYQCLEAYYSEHLLMRVPMIVTSMMMNVTRLLPKALPTTFGTPELVNRAKTAGHQHVKLLFPPVDVNLNAPGAVDPTPFREQYGIQQGDITIVTVSRLSSSDDIKFESLCRTIDAVGILARDLPLRFMIVGDGEVRSRLEHLAEKINTNLGRSAVVLAGAIIDPRSAYAAADIVVGMGGSALRGMAFGKPVVIVGAKGFSTPFTPETAESFLYKGMYGIGDGSSDNARLVRDIRGLAEHPDQLPALGEFSRQFVLNNFALEKVTAGFAEFCHFAIANQPRPQVAAVDGLRTAAVWLRERRWWE
jgi:glycosyltransferase involved in cell wall biosynthesis